jgi:hypothetical protein
MYLLLKVFTMFVIMALVTTVMTTPVVHYLYIRHRARFQKNDDSLYSVFLGVQNLRSAPWLVAVANLFTHGKESPLVKALLLTEISDRPSSYFFSEYYSMVQEAPVFGKKKSKLLSEIKNNLVVPGAEIATKTIASADLAGDVGAYCAKKSCKVLIWDMYYNVESVPVGKESIKTSVLASFDQKVQKVIKYDPMSKVRLPQYSIAKYTMILKDIGQKVKPFGQCLSEIMVYFAIEYSTLSLGCQCLFEALTLCCGRLSPQRKRDFRSRHCQSSSRLQKHRCRV